ncbi:MAG: 1-aminocyclopropane-1-carboxylate deaminase/D-cysteine desulfhydrase [Saprospiraceae bacterium]|nr:1-aminocyclopropane-1-carboxylate deaminase/D-cysteine desulfhydrase [Saprospiraceae bacterium]
MFFSENYIPSPLQVIQDSRLTAQNIRLFIKRDDLLHPSVSGNKFRKIKYNYLEMKRLGLKGVVTFGGAFSNHIHAVAAAGQVLGFPTVGIIRGDTPSISNATLTFAQTCGMTLHFVSRSEYRDKLALQEQFSRQYPDFYWLPEGGTNTFALEGAAEIVPEIITQLGAQPDYICLACGTGGTVSGIISASEKLEKPINIVGFSALKGDFLEKEVEKWLEMTSNPLFSQKIQKHWLIQNDYHFGGYAKWSMPLVDFINNTKSQFNLPLDPVYTGKMLFGVFDLIEKGFFPKHSTIVAVHTGGLQGIAGFNQRFGHLIYL